MKKINLGQTINTFANICVIVGILFLAFEVKQFDQQLKSQSRFNYYDNRINSYSNLAFHPELIEIGINIREGEEVSEAEFTSVLVYIISTYTSWEYEYFEYRDGRINIVELNVDAKRNVVNNQVLPFERAWESYSQSAPEPFVKFVEDNIFNLE